MAKCLHSTSDAQIRSRQTATPATCAHSWTNSIASSKLKYVYKFTVWLSLQLTGCIDPDYVNRPEPEKVNEIPIGDRCVSDRQCNSETFCYFGDEKTKGSSGQGICVSECDGTCSHTAPKSRCVSTQNDGDVCMPSCTVGESDFEKCGGFPDVVCESLSDGSSNDGDAVCHPLCSADSDCRSDSFCNRATGVCSTDRSDGLAYGTSCPTDIGTCAGQCVIIGQEPLCTHRCVLGAVENCGDDDHPGVCFFAGDSESVGDVGFCSELCSTDADCSAGGFTCELFEDEELEATFGAVGVCNLTSSG